MRSGSINGEAMRLNCEDPYKKLCFLELETEKQSIIVS